MIAVQYSLLISIAFVARIIPLSLSFTISHVSTPLTIKPRRGVFRMAFIDMPPAQPAYVDILMSALAPSVSSRTSTSLTNNVLHENIARWSATSPDASSTSTSTMLLSIQEYRKPTAEEIAAKRLTFNLWFWGGGIVAPFLATIYYFGFKFWER
jgi:hypothetical protein